MMNLPNDFLNDMTNLLGESDFALYIDSLSQKSSSAIRINRSKISVDDFIKIAPFEIEKIPFSENGFYINDTDAASKHPYYFAGLYYIQEPSAMIPASILPISFDDKVLDLCAAPGGKTTEAITHEPMLLIANDISYSRNIPLVKNLELAGAKNIMVTAESPEKLSEIYPHYFSRIIVDAPCSGEGMFRKDPGLIKSWEEKGPSSYTDTQFSVLSMAAAMLSAGGYIVYSTCTFDRREDEEIIEKFLHLNPDFELCEVKKFEGFADGIQCGENAVELKKCIRIYPHRLRGEGHFAALLHNKGEIDVTQSDKHVSPDFIKESELPEAARDFLAQIKKEAKDDYFYIKDNMLFMLSKNCCRSFSLRIHYSRTGTLVGQIKGKKGFVPNTGLALRIKDTDFSNRISFSAEDERVKRYLRGETIFLEDRELCNIENGYLLLCVNQYPLGFAKIEGNRLKNLYNQGWRMK